MTSNLRTVQRFLLAHERMWRKLRRHLRNRYYRMVMAAMGRKCQICDGVTITDPEFTYLGNSVTLNENVILLTFNSESTITIGDNVTISYGVNVITGGLDISNGIDHSRHVYAPVVIECDAWIGAQAIILSGVTVGAGAVVAAGSVVTCDVPPNVVVAGNPARPLRDVSAVKAG